MTLYMQTTLLHKCMNIVQNKVTCDLDSKPVSSTCHDLLRVIVIRETQKWRRGWCLQCRKLNKKKRREGCPLPTS